MGYIALLGKGVFELEKGFAWMGLMASSLGWCQGSYVFKSWDFLRDCTFEKLGRGRSLRRGRGAAPGEECGAQIKG